MVVHIRQDNSECLQASNFVQYSWINGLQHTATTGVLSVRYGYGCIIIRL